MKCLRPSFDTLINLRSQYSIIEISKKFKVSRATVCNWLKYFNISKTNKKLSNNQILTDLQIDVINGSLLGDAYIGYSDYNCRFAKVQCEKSLEYLQYTHDLLQPFSLNIIKNYTGKILNSDGKIWVDNSIKILQYKFYTVCHPIFNYFRIKWYPNGKKIVPRDITINPMLLLFWYLDDGSHNRSRKELTIYTDGFLEDDVKFLISKLQKIGINFNLFRHLNNFAIRSTINGYNNFFDYIKNCPKIKCFNRKYINV